MEAVSDTQPYQTNGASNCRPSNDSNDSFPDGSRGQGTAVFGFVTAEIVALTGLLHPSVCTRCPGVQRNGSIQSGDR